MKKRRKTDRIFVFTIGAKMVTIVTLIVLVSLGSITALVSWLVRQDLQISAEDSNFESNRRSAAEAEEIFFKMRSDAQILIQMVTSAGTRSALARETSQFFFEQNPRIAALYFTHNGAEGSLVNEQFFIKREIDLSVEKSYLKTQDINVKRATYGETVVINAAPHFNTNLLAMFFPGRSGPQMILFSPDSLNTSFGSGVNQSYMINNFGDILIHSNYELVQSAVNIADHEFIRTIRTSTDRTKQSLIETDFGVTPLVTSVNFGFLWDAWNKVRQFAGPYILIAGEHIKYAYNFCADAVCNAFHIDRNYNKKIREQKADAEGKNQKEVRQFVAFTKISVGGCIVITSIEYNKVFEGIAATTRRNIYLTIAVMLFSVILIWFFSKSISIPLKVLAAAARTIEGGEFDVKLTPKGYDEIGVLTSSFQKMCSALGVFGRFTNRGIALQAMRGQIKPGGLPKHATIFFSDIREFTAKCEKFTTFYGFEASNYIVRWLNDYFTSMINCVEKTDGIIDKFIGDAVMAHWGTAYTAGSPRVDAFNCVKAALMMRKELYFMNKQRDKWDPANPPIRIGCGINTGMVTAGQLGSDMRMEYTVIGDPVNLASRIEALTKPLGADILISEDTWNLVGDKFVTEEMPPVTVKGKEKPVRIFAVVNFIGEEKGPQSLDEVRELLGLQAPELESVDVNADEKKYNIGGDKK